MHSTVIEHRVLKKLEFNKLQAYCLIEWMSLLESEARTCFALLYWLYNRLGISPCMNKCTAY